MDDVIYFCRLREDAVIPSKRDEDAGYDIYANFEDVYMAFLPLETRLVPTGICGALPSFYYFQVEERSSTGSKGIKKSAGVIDSGYRGEYKIAVTNCTDKPLLISKLDSQDLPKEIDIQGVKFAKEDCMVYPYSKAIAQLVLHRVPQVQVKEISIEEFDKMPSLRGKGGFGSSNK